MIDELRRELHWLDEQISSFYADIRQFEGMNHDESYNDTIESLEKECNELEREYNEVLESYNKELFCINVWNPLMQEIREYGGSASIRAWSRREAAVTAWYALRERKLAARRARKAAVSEMVW